MKRGDGGIACYVAETMVCDRLHDIEDDYHEDKETTKKILVYYYIVKLRSTRW